MNVAIAVVLATAAGGGTLVVGGSTAGVLTGLAVFGGALSVIALRGYLVPGTPELTRRYLPEWLRDRFHDRPSGVDDGATLELAMKGVGANRSAGPPPTDESDGEETATSDS